MIGQTFSHYKILEKLGEGGMGVVYKAKDTKLERTVALKFLTEQAIGTQKDEKQRFLYEARAAASLNHPNICTIHEIDEHQGRSFIAMECIEGDRLKDKIASGPLPLKEMVDICIQLADGLQEAHQKGIVHRDIKPANIMISSGGRVKIMDFGLAKSPDRTQFTRTGTTMGTVAYMSPEQARGETTDKRADIWSFGVALYEMITGKLPFQGEHEQAILYSVLNKDPDPVTALRSGIPMELERVVTKAIAKHPNERYQHVDELLVDLRAFEKDLQSGKSSAQSAGAKKQKANKLMYFIIGFAAVALLIIVGLRFFGGGEEMIDSIAVLPLENLSGDAEQEYFADGMTEAIILNLSKIKALDVISRTSVMRYKGTMKAVPQIARELNVDAIVEGTVMRTENEVRITVQVIEGTTDRHLWAQSYDRPLRDILKLQSDIARAVAHEINIALSPKEQERLAAARQVDPAVHEAYLLGVHHALQFTGEGFQKARDSFQKAIDLDSTFAPAYASLAMVYCNLTFFSRTPPADVFPQAKVAAAKALELDENQVFALTVQAVIAQVYEWDWSLAEEKFRFALELIPGKAETHFSYSYMLACLGRHDEAIAEARRAFELDPLSPLVGEGLGMVLHLARRYDEAVTHLESMIDLSPHFWFTYLRLAQALMAKGEYDRAIIAMERAIELAGPATLRKGRATLAILYIRVGRESEALAILDDLDTLSQSTYVPPSDQARIYAALGNADEAFRYLDEAIEMRDGDLFMLGVLPAWDPLRSDPRFEELLRRMNFPEFQTVE